MAVFGVVQNWRVAMWRDLFLRVHTVVQSWRAVMLKWVRQLLRNHAPFDVTRWLQYNLHTRDGQYTWIRSLWSRSFRSRISGKAQVWYISSGTGY